MRWEGPGESSWEKDDSSSTEMSFNNRAWCLTLSLFQMFCFPHFGFSPADNQLTLQWPQSNKSYMQPSLIQCFCYGSSWVGHWQAPDYGLFFSWESLLQVLCVMSAGWVLFMGCWQLLPVSQAMRPNCCYTKGHALDPGPQIACEQCN